VKRLRALIRALRARPPLLDGVLALSLGAVVISESVSPGVTTPVAVALPVAVAMTLPLSLRRRWPVAAAAVVAAGFAALGLLDDSRQPAQTTLLALAVAVWSVAAYGSRTEARLGLGLVFLAILANEPGDFIVLGPLNGGVWAVGRLLRDRQRWASELEQRAVYLERDRAEDTRLAIVEERARIARELHDVVAHHVSVIVMQAGAERIALPETQTETRETLATIERTGREALAELRLLLGMLRREDEEIALAPQPSLDHLERLVEHVREAGLPIELTVEGERTPIPPGVDISAYRIVQEALTNALKHAGPARARVRVRYEPSFIEIEVADDGRGGGHGNGHGLAGMRERVTIFGGELDAGPRSEGGYLVRSRLPIEGAER
jgi:signal transduction histidine kinase